MAGGVGGGKSISRQGHTIPGTIAALFRDRSNNPDRHSHTT